jgi:hypothetical protein
MRYSLFGLAVVLAAVAGCSRPPAGSTPAPPGGPPPGPVEPPPRPPRPPASSTGPVEGSLAPEISGEDVEGRPMRLSEFRGKVVLLDFWGDW